MIKILNDTGSFRLLILFLHSDETKLIFLRIKDFFNLQ